MQDYSTQQYEYFAFISYKREDEKWASWLQRKLEYYRLPSCVRKENPALPEKIRPVFKDTTDLEPGVLAKKIQNALISSKFLIVICSPHSANSVWVSKEIQLFINSGRADNIIPFIVGGKPNAVNPNEECFPEGLRQLTGEQELLGANINEMGRDAAAVKVVAQMFNLRFDTLWQRYERQKRKEMKLLKKRNIELLRLQSRIVSSKCMECIERGDSYLSAKLILAFWNKLKKVENMPCVPAIEEIFRLSTQKRDCWYYGHSDSVTSLAFSNEGNLLITGSSDFTIKLWNQDNGDLITTLEQRNGLISSVDALNFNCSGELFASSTSRSIRIWQIETWSVLDYFEDPGAELSSTIRNLLFYKENVIYSIGSEICLYYRSEHSRKVLYKMSGLIRNVKLDHQNDLLFGKTQDALYVFDIVHDELKLINKFEKCIHFDINFNTRLLVTTTGEFTTLWEYKKERLSNALTAFGKKRTFHIKGIPYLSKDCKYIYVYFDGNVSVYRLEEADVKAIMTREVHDSKLSNPTVWINPYKELMYVASGASVRQIDISISRPDYLSVSWSLPANQEITAFIVKPNNKLLAVSEEKKECIDALLGSKKFDPQSFLTDLFNRRSSGLIILFDITDHKVQYVQLDDFDPKSIELSCGNSYLLVNQSKGYIILDSDSLKLYTANHADFNLSAFRGTNDDSCLIVTTAPDGYGIIEYDFKRNVEIKYGMVHCDLKNSFGDVMLKLSSSGKMLCLAFDKHLSVISMDTFEERLNLRLKNRILSLDFCKDSKKIAVSTDGDNALSVFDIKTSDLIIYKQLFNTLIRSVRYTSDGKYLLVCGDRKVLVFSTEGYEKVYEIDGEISHGSIIDAQIHDNSIISLDRAGYLRICKFEQIDKLLDMVSKRFGSCKLCNEILMENYIV